MKSALRILIVFLMLLPPLRVSARTWYIKADGTGNAPTVQAGIDSAAAGDTVLVACGTYYEHNILMKSGVCLRGEEICPPCVTIDAQQNGSLIICNLNNPSTVIDGLTLTHGSSPAMNCNGPTESGPTIRNCVFSDNMNPTVGVVFGSPLFQNCLFYGNHGSGATIVIAYLGAQPSISNCTFVNNSAGIAVTTGGSANVEKCIIAYCDGFSLGNDDSSGMSVTCCNLFGNGSARDDSATVNCIPDCFMADPQFCGVPGSHNYYLQSDSPCAPGNHPDGIDCGLIGAYPVNCGEVAAKKTTWGSMKSRFRE